MCWSQRVSLFFWLYDVACLVYLYRRRRQDDAKYIAMLFGVMLQEWWQFVVWRVRDDHCTPALAIASVGAVLSSQSITLGVLAAGEMDVTKGDETRRRRQGASLALWALQLVVTAACVVRAGRWCASIGTWGHQIWICAQSLYEVGGYPLYLGMLAVYVAALIQAFKALSLPAREKSALKTLGCVNAAFIYALYTTTLEACIFPGVLYPLFFRAIRRVTLPHRLDLVLVGGGSRRVRCRSTISNTFAPCIVK